VSDRITPFALVFGEIAEERFPGLKASLGAAQVDPADRDAFILDKAVTEFLRDLVPEDAPPESLHEFIAVLQHGYLFWQGGGSVKVLSGTEPPTDRHSLAPDSPSARKVASVAASPAYVQLPSHLYWGQPEPEGPHEPVDGFFIHPAPTGIRALAIFGLHRERPGFSVAEVAGAAPTSLPPRADGSAPFAPQMDGGAAAGIRSVAGPDELLALAWHALTSEA
jgi:hypothetical protein